MDAVEDVIVILPEPVFLFDGSESLGGIGLGDAWLGAVNPVGEDSGELLIAVLGGDKAGGGEGDFGLGVEGRGGREEIDESE